MIKMVIGIADGINDESINLWKHQQSSFCGGRLSLDCEVCDKFSTSVESEGSFFCSSIMCALSVSLVLIVNGTFMSFLPSDVSFLDVIS